MRYQTPPEGAVARRKTKNMDKGGTSEAEDTEEWETQSCCTILLRTYVLVQIAREHPNILLNAEVLGGYLNEGDGFLVNCAVTLLTEISNFDHNWGHVTAFHYFAYLLILNEVTGCHFERAKTVMFWASQIMRDKMLLRRWIKLAIDLLLSKTKYLAFFAAGVTVARFFLYWTKTH
uniref:Uncharacterized protein n=1 Tax=Electrophorus electricus TaxID=8005 RepID=A0A4W4H075_ELEEL